jgi:hypothetical protein
VTVEVQRLAGRSVEVQRLAGKLALLEFVGKLEEVGTELALDIWASAKRCRSVLVQGKTLEVE